MALVIVGITGSTMYLFDWIAQKGEHERLYIEFRANHGELSGGQEARRAVIAERCRTLARSVRILAALEENDLEELYLRAVVELRDVLGGGDQPRDDGLPELMNVWRFAFIDVDGEVLLDPNGAASEPWIAQLGMDGIPDGQETGYIVVPDTEDRDSIYEVIATTVVSTWNGEAVGAIVIGFEPVELMEREGVRGVTSGLLLDRKLYLPTLSAVDEGAVNRDLAGILDHAETEKEEEGTEVDVLGSAHLAFTKSLNPGSRLKGAKDVSLFPLRNPWPGEQSNEVKSG